MRILLFVLCIAPVSAYGDECSDAHPGGAPPPTKLQKTRFDLAASARDSAAGGTVAAELIVHPQVDLGVRATYAHSLEGDGSGVLDVVAEARVMPLFVFGGIGSDGVCGMKGRQWKHGAPYLVIALGGWSDRSADHGGFVFAPGAGWDYPLGRRLSLFVEGGGSFASSRGDTWTATAGVRF